jgi:hypothetical protein
MSIWCRSQTLTQGAALKNPSPQLQFSNPSSNPEVPLSLVISRKSENCGQRMLMMPRMLWWIIISLHQSDLFCKTLFIQMKEAQRGLETKGCSRSKGDQPLALLHCPCILWILWLRDQPGLQTQKDE